MHRNTRWSRAAALALVTLVTVLPASAAEAKDGDIMKRGSCSGTADWKLKASPQDGRIEVEGEVDSNRNGQKWRWSITHNGSLSDRGTKKTVAPSGSFEVRRVLVNVKGDDRIVFRARKVGGSHVCRGALTF
jgi:hypothetical protein